MKKLLLALPLAGMLMLTGCNNDLLDDANGPDNQIATANNFLTVSVVPTNGMNTRADDGVYEDGTSVENNVTSVRFYFFDGSGNATPVWENRSEGTYNSYIDWYPNSSDVSGPTQDDKDITVEKNLHTTLGLVIPSGASNPVQVLAVLNPTQTLLNNIPTNSEYAVGDNKITLNGPSLSQLQGITDDYLTNLTGVVNRVGGNFVMSNSVYVDSDDQEVVATTIASNSFGTSLEEAEANPVTIFVERVLARLDFGIGSSMTLVELDNGEKAYSTGDPYTVDNVSTDIYVQFIGWNVTSTADKSNLIKAINTDWGENLFEVTGEPWNIPGFHRSFWAINAKGMQPLFGDFNGGTITPSGTVNQNPANKLPIPATGYEITYLQENANKYGATGAQLSTGGEAAVAPENPSKVIIAAKLVDKNGDPLNLAEWNYHKYTVDNLLIQLCNNELNQLYFTKTGDAANTYTKIDPSCLTFKTAEQLGLETDDADYYVYLVLSDTEVKDGDDIVKVDATAYNWYLKTGTGNNPEDYSPFQSTATPSKASYELANGYIYNKIHHVRVWNEGMTYYFFNIHHLGAEGTQAYNGIVRNHIYRCTVTKVQGIGTPVYNPDQVIFPEENIYDESIVTADIKILQWRVVSNDYELNWK